MSRTYKDRPYWVRLNDKREARTPFHRHHNWYTRNNGWEVCTFGEPYTGGTDEWRRNCGYYLGYRRHTCYAPKDYIRDMYYSPMRNDERMVLRNAAKDYNSFGEIDEDFFLNERSRHATYGGGYWD